jgi:alpha-glucuronidase
MLAEALKPYHGVVMWRAFVYEPSSEDRAKQAYNEFVPLDGKFADNVIIQVKNGPVDFQPREPFSPLFGAMPHTALMVEFQITQEYLGFSDHLVFLAPLQKECLESDTWCKGQGSTVAKITNGTLYPGKLTAIAGVANIGRDTNWCGHHFAQANWYAFGRLAWNQQLTPSQIALEWLRMTFSTAPNFTVPAREIMMRSREAAVNYMTPLGLHHLMGWSHHHGPEPWTDIRNARPDWLPRYFHNATEEGIGFDRSSQGSKAVTQYCSPLQEMYDHPETCPDNLLLWFHHLPWTYSLPSGKTVWEELCYHYYSGVEETRLFQKKWDDLEQFVDPQRFRDVQYKLKVQTKEAVWWRDACLLYFQTFSKMKIPAELERPVYDLDELKKQKFNLTNHN